MPGLLDKLTNGTIVDLRDGTTWDAETLRRQVAGRSLALDKKGITKGDVVFIVHGNSPEAIADLIAVWAAGAVAATLNPALTLPEIKNLESFCHPKAILAGRDFPHSPSDFDTPVLVLEGDLENGGTNSQIRLSASDPALILFTSGTTGTPKGVVHTRASLEAKIKSNIETVSGAFYERSLCVLSSHFVAGLVANILSPLAAGKTVYLFPNPGIAGAGEIGALVDRHGITMINTVPSFWRMVLKASPKPVKHTLKFIGVASAPLGPDIWQAVMDWSGTGNVWNMYGTTETGGWNIGISGQDAKPRKGLIGKPLGTDVSVRKANGDILASGEGEIVLRSTSLMKEYYRRPDLSASAIEEGWFRTGDLGRIDPGGAVSIIGRLNSIINRAGVKVVPEEVETLVETHPDVLEACVFSLPDSISGETVAAAVVAPQGRDFSPQTLRDWCKTHIRQECIPEKWWQLDELPRTENGKINRMATREICLDKKT